MSSITLRALVVVALAAQSALTLPASVQPAFVLPFNCTDKSVAKTAKVNWKSSDAAVKWGEWPIEIGIKKLPVLIVAVVVAPKQTKLALDIARDSNTVLPWSIANAPSGARFAMNAGQFTDAGPWGWVVHRGREHQPPGAGAVAGALIVDSAGVWSLLDAAEIGARRGRNILEAVQSYPTLIGANGTVPRALCAPGRNVDLEHRDARLAIGTLVDGSLLIAMTRFNGLGATAGRLPLGPTTPEMVNIMRALGATRALMLDGGLSAQLLLRVPLTAPALEWPGLRKVPLALVGIPAN